MEWKKIFEGKLQKSKTGQFFLSIPNKICRLKSWNKEGIVVIGEEKGSIILKK